MPMRRADHSSATWLIVILFPSRGEFDHWSRPSKRATPQSFDHE